MISYKLSGQVADELGVTRQYLLRRANEARIETVMVGTIRLWTPDKIEAIKPLVTKSHDGEHFAEVI